MNRYTAIASAVLASPIPGHKEWLEAIKQAGFSPQIIITITATAGLFGVVWIGQKLIAWNSVGKRLTGHLLDGQN